MLCCLGQSPPWSRWEGGSSQQGFSLSSQHTTGPMYLERAPLFFPLAPFCFSPGVRDRLQLENPGQGFEVQGGRNFFLRLLLPLAHMSRLRESPAESRQAEEMFWGICQLKTSTDGVRSAGCVGWSLGASLCHLLASPQPKKQDGTWCALVPSDHQ